VAGALAVFFVVDRFARARVAVFFFLVARLRVCVVFVPEVAATPDETRVECFGRCLTLFCAASADDTAVNAASMATSSIFIVLRMIRRSSDTRYDTSPRRLCYGFF
jgi:hypothetical protein